MNTQLGSKYPIVAMAMNRVSDIPLAFAVNDAGGIPSLSVFNYYIDTHTWDSSLLEKDLKAYKEKYNEVNILLSLGVDQILDPNIQRLILDYRIKFIELVPDSGKELLIQFPNITEADINQRNRDTKTIVNLIRQQGSLVFVKMLSKNDIIDHEFLFDGVILKGPNGAGRVSNIEHSLEDLFASIQASYPNLLIIVSGGISTSEQVKFYIDRGALAVGIGTLLAASVESKVSLETKQKIIEASKDDVGSLTRGAHQNALVFNELEKDSFNNTRGMMIGMRNPTQGHIFVGRGIENVTAILPVSDIIQRLVQEL